MKYNRTNRIVKELQKAISLIIQKKIRDPRINIITILEVRVSKDLSQAKIFVSFLNENSFESIRILQNASGFIRTCLSKYMKLRIVPKLIFLYDKSFQNVIHISNLINKYKK